MINHKRIRLHTIWVACQILIDMALCCCAGILALLIRFEGSFGAVRDHGLWSGLFLCLPFLIAMTLGLFLLVGVYRWLWQYAGGVELMKTGFACLGSAVLFYLLNQLLGAGLPRSIPLIYLLILYLEVLGTRYLFRLMRHFLRRELFSDRAKARTMIIGAGDSAAMAIREFTLAKDSANRVVCIIDDDPARLGQSIRGSRVVGGRDKILWAVEHFAIEEIIFCIPSASAQARKEILQICNQTKARLKTLPTLSQIANGQVSVQSIREIQLEDLLGREPITVDNPAMADMVRDRVVLVTGGGGSIGGELCRQIAALRPKELIIFDIYENNAYDLQQELKKRFPALNLNVQIGSVRDRERVDDLFSRFHPELVYHAAAHKHVPLMEDSPSDAVKNNVFGTYNVSDAAGRNGASLFLLVSTDKAVNPTNVMGATKRLCEMVVQSMNSKYATRYVAVRFGNVLGSNGSVVPLFKKQIAAGGPVTVTHKEVTRFFMTIPEAVSLILQAAVYARGGEVFVLDMGQPVKIDDMARQMIRLCGLEPDVDIPIEYVGLRPGEKLYEELLLKSEGLQNTENNLIYIGRQTLYTPEQIQNKLAALMQVLDREPQAVRDLVFRLIAEPQTVCAASAD